MWNDGFDRTGLNFSPFLFFSFLVFSLLRFSSVSKRMGEMEDHRGGLFGKIQGRE